MEIEIKKWVTPAIVGVASFSLGAVAGYFFKKNRDANKLSNLQAEIVDHDIEIEEISSNVAGIQFRFDENLERMNSVMQQANRVIVGFLDSAERFKEKNDPKNIRIEAGYPDPEIHPNEYPDGIRPEDVGWDYTEEVKNRSAERPYVIHRDEYFSNESEYTQSSLTYYKGDNILCDEGDVPVYNPERVVGKLLFGHGSGDPSIVYIRNEKQEGEWEIILDEGFYQSEVLGAQVEEDLTSDNIKHSLLKFKGDTD